MSVNDFPDQILRKSAEEIAANEYRLRVVTGPGSAGSIQLKTAVNGAVSIDSTPVIARVGASNLADRVLITITPIDGDIWVGFSGSVSDADGMPLESGSIATIFATESLDVYIVSSGPTVDVRMLEGSDK